MARSDTDSPFVSNLQDITGTHWPQERLGDPRSLELISNEYSTVGDLLERHSRIEWYINSGSRLVADGRPLSVYSVAEMGIGGDNFFATGADLEFTEITMPAAYQPRIPFCYPGGAVVTVLEGRYQDVNPEGGVIRDYPRGSVVFYKKGAVHIPVSDAGTLTANFLFNGLFESTMDDLLTELGGRIGDLTTEKGFEYATKLMEQTRST